MRSFQEILFLFVVTALFWSCDTRYGQTKIEYPDALSINNESVLEAINEKLEQNPQNPSLWKRKVNFLENNNWPSGSEETIKRALELSPEDGELHYQDGLFRAQNDDLNGARQSLDEAGKLGFLTAGYFLSYAEVLIKLGLIDQAFEQLNKFQELDPSNYRSHELRGKVFLERADTVNALAALEKAASLNSDKVEISLQLIDLYFAVDDTAQYRRLDQILRAEDNSVLIRLALIKQGYGFITQANQDYFKVLKRDSAFTTAALYLANNYWNLNRLDSALKYSNYVIERDSTNLLGRLITARVMDRRYRYQSAIRAYEDLLAIDSTYENAKSELISVYRKVAYLRRFEEAKESLPKFDLSPRTINNSNNR